MSVKLTLTQGNFGRSFMWLSLHSNDIYWGFTGGAIPSHYSYHESGLLHHRYDCLVPILPGLSRMNKPQYKYGYKEPLSNIKGIEPLFAGWVSLHPVTVSNLTAVDNLNDHDFMKCELPSDINQPVIGYEASLIESSRSDLIPLLNNISWEAYWVTHKIFILEKERPNITKESVILQEYIIKDYSPWLIVRFWDGLPPVLSDKINEWEFKGIGLAMPATKITELLGKTERNP